MIHPEGDAPVKGKFGFSSDFINEVV